MNIIPVKLGPRSYKITIGSGILNTYDFSSVPASAYIVIADKKVFSLATSIEVRLKKIAQTEKIILAGGEKIKRWNLVEQIGRKLAQKELDKKSCIVAIGGGTIGDFAGLVASVYKRGISLIHVPTTLLAQVDSSIGGKTGVNIPEGKNLLGTIYQPKAVLIDVDVLSKLPQKEIIHAFAEVIKYAMIDSPQFFTYLEKNIARRDKAFLIKLITESVQLKTRIIERDENESGLREIFNYGHTVGHAIETASKNKIPHGSAVSMGMVCEGKIAVNLGFFSEADLRRQNNLLVAAGLPIKHRLNPSVLIEYMRKDKKAKNNKIHFVLPAKIGKVKKSGSSYSFPVNESVLKKILSP